MVETHIDGNLAEDVSSTSIADSLVARSVLELMSKLSLFGKIEALSILS